MNKSVAGILLVVGLVVVISANAVPTEAEHSKTIEIEKDRLGVTPYKSIFLGNQAKVQCWVCSAPCSHGMCCNDGYPQCCLVGEVCRCCRS